MSSISNNTASPIKPGHYNQQILAVESTVLQ